MFSASISRAVEAGFAMSRSSAPPVVERRRTTFPGEAMRIRSLLRGFAADRAPGAECGNRYGVCDRLGGGPRGLDVSVMSWSMSVKHD